MRTAVALSLLALLPGALAHRALAGRKKGSDDAAAANDATDPGPVTPPSPLVLLQSPGNLTTCQAVQLTWSYNPRALPASTCINIDITNVGVDQTPPQPPSTSSSTTSSSSSATIASVTSTGTFPTTTPALSAPPARVHTRQSQDITQTVAAGISLAAANGARLFNWNAVNVTAGWYVLDGSPFDGDNATFGASARFYVALGDTSCLSAVSTGTSSSPGASASAGIGLPISTVAHKSVAAPIIGAVVGVLAGLALLVGAFFLWTEYRRRRGGAGRRSSGGAAAHYGLGSHDSRAPRASSSQHSLPPVGLAARAASASAPTLEGYDDDGSWDEKPIPMSDHRQSMASGISAYMSSGARPRATSEGYPLGVLPRALPAGAAVARAPSGARRTARKPVPAYDPRELDGVGDDETVVGGSVPDGGKDLGFKLANNGSNGQLHFLIPDLPPPAR